MSKPCCNLQFRTFEPNNDYSTLECLIMNLYSLAIIKNPVTSKDKVKMLKEQAKMLYKCCNHPSKINHSFGELKEHVKYENTYNITEAKEIWKKSKGKKKK